MSKATGVFIFAFGVVVGAGATWRYAKNYYERRAQEEIDSVKEAFSRRAKNTSEKSDSEESKNKDEDKYSDYTRIVSQERYVTDDKSPTIVQNGLYVISPEEFGEIEEYDRISLTYYADQVLADENDEKIEDVDHVVGLESLTHFGEYEDDSVFVRNDRMKCDYEILMDTRTYFEILQQRPHSRRTE